MRGGVRSVAGSLLYTSTKPDRQGQQRGREHFRMDVHGDGCRTIAAHAEIDDPPPVVRDVNLRVDAAGLPQESFVRIAVDGEFRGSAWFRFSEHLAECEGYSTREGRFSQRMALTTPLPAFGNHAIINDGYLMSRYPLAEGPGVHLLRRMLLSSPDHRGATGPMLFAVDVAIEYLGQTRLTVAAGNFAARHFRIVDVPGMPDAHPAYDLWCTADDDHVLLKAAVGGYMQTAYELDDYQVNEHPA